MPAIVRPALAAASTDLVLQRAVSDIPAGTQVGASSPTPSPPDGEPPSPTPATPGIEGPDLERLADEVMAIIERRLVVQRESLGL